MIKLFGPLAIVLGFLGVALGGGHYFGSGYGGGYNVGGQFAINAGHGGLHGGFNFGPGYGYYRKTPVIYQTYGAFNPIVKAPVKPIVYQPVFYPKPLPFPAPIYKPTVFSIEPSISYGYSYKLVPTYASHYGYGGGLGGVHGPYAGGYGYGGGHGYAGGHGYY